MAEVHPQYPGLEDQILRVRTVWQKQRADAKTGWIKRITRALEDADHDLALRLLSEASREFPGDDELPLGIEIPVR